MPTRYSESDHIGDEAINFISTACTFSRRALFLERPRKDIGIDAHIELVNDMCEPTGALAFIQSKGGLSYTKTGRYQIKADKKHFETWSRYTIPVIGIVYNPILRNARWVSISEHLRSHPDSIQTGPYIIEAPADQPFSAEEFTKFSNYIEACHSQQKNNSNQEQHTKSRNDLAQVLVDQYFSGDVIKKVECLTQLFTLYRWTPFGCFFFHQALRIEEELTIVDELTYLISFYRPHWDRHYNPDITMPKQTSLESLAHKCIASFGKAEVLKMLSTIDENGLERGSMGQLVAIQLEDISNIEHTLCEIAKDSSLETQIRGYAILILAAFLGFSDVSFYQSLRENENDSFIIEALDWALQWGIDEPEESNE